MQKYGFLFYRPNNRRKKCSRDENVRASRAKDGVCKKNGLPLQVYVRESNILAYYKFRNEMILMNMKALKIATISVLLGGFVAVCGTAYAGVRKSKVMTRNSDGTYIVNTQSLAKDVKGYGGQTPLKIYIKNDKIEKVEALANNETPGFFASVKTKLLERWKGMSAKKAAEGKVDGVSGATLSSKAVKENVKRGAKYYLDNK